MVVTVLHRMNPLNHTLWSLSSAAGGLEDFADAAEVDLVGRLLPVLAPDRGEEECPGVAVAGVAVAAQADRRSFCLQLPLFPLFLLLRLPVFLVSCEEVCLTASGEPPPSDLNDWRVLAPLGDGGEVLGGQLVEHLADVQVLLH